MSKSVKNRSIQLLLEQKVIIYSDQITKFLNLNLLKEKQLKRAVKKHLLKARRNIYLCYSRHYFGGIEIIITSSINSSQKIAICNSEEL